MEKEGTEMDFEEKTMGKLSMPGKSAPGISGVGREGKQ